MKKHPKAGMPVRILSGPFKGQTFLVIDFLVNQFQGKSIDKLVKAQVNLCAPLIKRGVAVDQNTVFGQLYPTMTFMILPDEELTKKEEETEAKPEKVEAKSEEDNNNVLPMTKKGGKRDTTRSSKKDNSDS